jgi:hypothetical protein
MAKTGPVKVELSIPRRLWREHRVEIMVGLGRITPTAVVRADELEGFAEELAAIGAKLTKG